MSKIILASQSPRRQELLKYVVSEFEIEPSNVDETIDTSMDPKEAVKILSDRKASHVANNHSEGFVLGSDTVISFENKIVGKAENRQDAFKLLAKMSGKTHEVLTGVTLLNASTNERHQIVVTTEVTFINLSDELINWYLDSGEYEDKAGSYAIQGKGAVLVEKINGCYYNVMGFPISSIYKLFGSLNLL